MAPKPNPKRFVSGDKAIPARGQHTTPCGDCPWRRTALPGWLGNLTAKQWIDVALSDEKVLCHTTLGAQCAGTATFRANICKSPRNPDVLRLPANRDTVFAWPDQFIKFHEDEPNDL